jgi:hypothetical protein
VQDLRKELDLDIAAEIGLRLAGAERLSGFVELVQKECRCSAVELVAAVQRPTKVWSIDGESVVCHVEAAGLQHGAVKAA